MTKKHLVFIILLTIAAMLIWIAGEIVIVMYFKSGKTVSVIWTVLMAALTLGLSLWKGLKDESGKNNRKW